MADNKLNSPNQAFPNFNDVLKNAASDVTSIFSIKPMAKYLSGARCVLRLNGKIVGFAFGISWSIETESTEVRTIDDYMPYELAPKQVSVSGTITGFRMPGFGPTSEGLQPDILSFLHQRYIEIEVRDSQSDSLIFLTKRALITSRSEDIKTNSLANMTLNFKAIGFADEKTPQYPIGHDSMNNVDLNGTNPIDNLVNKVSGAVDSASAGVKKLFK